MVLYVHCNINKCIVLEQLVHLQFLNNLNFVTTSCIFHVLKVFKTLFSDSIPSVQGVAFFPRIIILTDGVATPQHVTGNRDFIPDMSDMLTVYINL